MSRSKAVTLATDLDLMLPCILELIYLATPWNSVLFFIFH